MRIVGKPVNNGVSLPIATSDLIAVIIILSIPSRTQISTLFGLTVQRGNLIV